MKPETHKLRARTAKDPEVRAKHLRQWKAHRERDAITGCTLCPLHTARKNAVPWSGSLDAEILVIGEAPGADEDKQGVPFVGKAGQLFDKALAQAGIDRDTLMFMNVISCRPPQNRRPSVDEMRACTGHYEKQLELSKAWIVLLAGNTPSGKAVGLDYGITTHHGRGIWKDGRLWMPIFHPSYVLRGNSKTNEMDLLVKDLELVRDIRDGNTKVPFERVKGKLRVNGGHDIRDALDMQGWVHVYSAALEDRIVVVKHPDVKLPSAFEETPTYTLDELARMRLLADERGYSVTEIQRLHNIKRVLGGELIR